MKRKTTLLLITILLFSLVYTSAFAAKLKVGIVQMNYVINKSILGKASKKLLQAKTRLEKQRLNLRRQEIEKLQTELKNGFMLSNPTKQRKRIQIQKLRREYVGEARKVQRELQVEQRRQIQRLFGQIRKVVQTVGKRKKFDLVLEQTITQQILYYSEDMIDLSNEVVKAFDKLQSGK
ncbi:MAG: Skp family chaperone for outer membrane protein [bacterium]|jgi:Skp family chaperone for outer membrane proteins